MDASGLCDSLSSLNPLKESLIVSADYINFMALFCNWIVCFSSVGDASASEKEKVLKVKL